MTMSWLGTVHDRHTRPGVPPASQQAVRSPIERSVLTLATPPLNQFVALVLPRAAGLRKWDGGGLLKAMSFPKARPIWREQGLCRLMARRRSQRMSAPTSAFGGEPEMFRTGLIRRC
jgi:hypothetical protein